MYYTYKDTPIGQLLFIGDGKKLTGLHFAISKHLPTIGKDWIEDASVFAAPIQQLDEYLAGKRQAFDLPIETTGTTFQKKVWQELDKIPFGRSVSYKDIAVAVGNPKAVRAVGTAVGSNPICVIGPCHRVLAASGKIGGYAGGLKAKEYLLKLEKIATK